MEQDAGEDVHISLRPNSCHPFRLSFPSLTLLVLCFYCFCLPALISRLLYLPFCVSLPVCLSLMSPPSVSISLFLSVLCLFKKGSLVHRLSSPHCCPLLLSLWPVSSHSPVFGPSTQLSGYTVVTLVMMIFTEI